VRFLVTKLRLGNDSGSEWSGFERKESKLSVDSLAYLFKITRGKKTTALRVIAEAIINDIADKKLKVCPLAHSWRIRSFVKSRTRNSAAFPKRWNALR